MTNTDTQGKCPACRAVYRWHGLPLLRDALCPRHQTPLRRTTNRRDWPVLRAKPGAHECGPLCPEHGDARDSSVDVTRVPPCDRCGSEPVEAYALPSGNIEAFCTACTEAPRHHGYVAEAVAR